MIITISGKPGSGKSTVADRLAERFGMKRYSVGDFRRELAKKRGMTIAEFNLLGEKEEFTDKDADNWQKEIGIKENNFIIDGRLSFYFIPNSIKIFLSVRKEVGAERVMRHDREEEKVETIEEAIEKLDQRIKSDIKRYKEYYNLNPYEKNKFDFVLDTSDLSIEEVVERVMGFVEKSNEK